VSQSDTRMLHAAEISSPKIWQGLTGEAVFYVPLEYFCGLTVFGLKHDHPQ